MPSNNTQGKMKMHFYHKPTIETQPYGKLSQRINVLGLHDHLGFTGFAIVSLAKDVKLLL